MIKTRSSSPYCKVLQTLLCIVSVSQYWEVLHQLPLDKWSGASPMTDVSACPLIIFSTALISVLFVLLDWKQKEAPTKNQNSRKHYQRISCLFWNFLKCWNQTCEKTKGENKERVLMQHWFDEFIVCYVN